MDYGKYVIIEHLGHEIAIMFHSILNHSDIVNSTMEVVSAGFFIAYSKPTDADKDDIGVCVWGKSVSLKKIGRQQDSELLKKVLRKEEKY